MREQMEFDLIIVGAGPAGLAAAIRAKQLSPDLNVCVLEKGAEVGAHILSGAVIDPKGLDELLPEWRNAKIKTLTPVKEDKVMMLSKKGGFTIPNFLLPKSFHNQGNFIASLGNVCRYLGEVAEGLGIEIYPGFPASEVLYDDNGRVKGVATNDMGRTRDGGEKPTFEAGMELLAPYTLFAEGVRGSLSKALIKKFNLDEGRQPQTYGIGIKELWQLPEGKGNPGRVIHTTGWPINPKLHGSKTWGGSFCYHMENDLLALGYVVGLDYQNPYMSPYEEFQQWKTHPKIAEIIGGGERISYGARALNEGGLQSVPKLIFPGGALVGCSAGFLNVPRIKGSHNAIKTGMMAAESAIDALKGDKPPLLESYEQSFESSWVKEELHTARNFRPAFAKWGKLGFVLGGLELKLLRGKTPWTLMMPHQDHESLWPKEKAPEISYPSHDGKLTFDKMASVYLANTNHQEDEPVHLQLTDKAVAINHNLALYDAPEQRYCPAGVYEIVHEGDEPCLRINAQNCVHCKTCDIKDPTQNITWVTPEGGGGPNYADM